MLSMCIGIKYNKEELNRNTSMFLDFHEKIKDKDVVENLSQEMNDDFIIDGGELNKQIGNVITPSCNNIGGLNLLDFMLLFSILNGNHMMINKLNENFVLNDNNDINRISYEVIRYKLNEDITKAFITFFEYNISLINKNYIENNPIYGIDGSDESKELFEYLTYFIQTVDVKNLIKYKRDMQFVEKILNKDEKIMNSFRKSMIDSSNLHKEFLDLTDVNFTDEYDKSLFMSRVLRGKTEDVRYLIENYDVRLIISKYSYFNNISIELLELISSLENFHDFIQLNKETILEKCNEEVKRYIENL